MSIWFVTPAWKRFELSAVCFAQRKHVIDELAKHGIEGRCVVIADDANLDIARDQGFDVLERNNEWLGRRFNDGTEYAAKHGADWIVPIGSDSWIDPAYFLPLPNPRLTRTSRYYSVVENARAAELSITYKGLCGPYMFNRQQLAASRFRPAKDLANRNIDSATVHGAGAVKWQAHDLHPYQYLGFRGEPHITSYNRLVQRWGVVERTDHWDRLAKHYPLELVNAARAVMA